MSHHKQAAPGDRRRGFSVMELLFVLALFGIMAAIAIPMAQPAVNGYQIAGQAHAVAYNVSLAKMQAASGFTRARLFIDLGGNSYRLERWNDAAGEWVAPDGATTLPGGVGFGYGSLADPPPDTQGTLGQAAACYDASNAAVTGTSCVLFNSRGVPIDHTGTPTPNDVVYLTDGRVIYAVAVSPAGLTQLWWTPTHQTAWQKQ